MQSVLYTKVFLRQAERAGLEEDDVQEICTFLAANPQSGVVVRGTGGVRKVRFAGRGKGKSGGFRTIHYYTGDDIPVFLLGLIDKGERADLSQAERNELAKSVPTLATEYRKGAGTTVSRLQKR
jgi:hypothetical protein